MNPPQKRGPKPQDSEAPRNVRLSVICSQELREYIRQHGGNSWVVSALESKKELEQRDE